jgi:hypothetical protein
MARFLSKEQYEEIGHEYVQTCSTAVLRAECERRGVISGNLALVDLLRASDDSLRSECNWRWGEDDCLMAKTLRHERDELKAEVAMLRARIDEGYLPQIARLMRLNESGAGIADADQRPDNSIAHLDEDLLCEDA